MLSYSVRVALIAALGGFLFGFETAVISGAEATLRQLWSLDSFWLGFTVTSSLIGTVIGSLIVGKPAQAYGRKKVLVTIAIVYVFSSISCALAPAWVVFLIFRFLGGIAVGASSVVGPMYISEIAPANLRGRLAGSFQLNIVAGILAALLANFLLIGIGENAWRYMFGVMIVPSLLFWVLLKFIPESPRWLVLQNREAEAVPVLETLGETDIAERITAIRESVKLHTENLFQAKYAKPIIYAVVLAMINQLSGINAIFYYAPRIFEMAGFSQSAAFLQPVFVGLANLIFTIVAMLVIDKFGRKNLLLIGIVGVTIFLVLVALAFGESRTGSNYLLIYLIGYIAFFAFSLGAVLWVFISEIFPNSVRSQGAALGSFTHWIMAAIISWTFPIVVEDVPNGGFYAFIFFAVTMVAAFIFTLIVMPETKGKSLERIQEELGIE